MVRAAGFGPSGGFVLRPPVSKDEAERDFGAAISDDAWRKICDAFRRHGERLDRLKYTRDNRNRNDAQGWHKRKSDAERALEAAEVALSKIDRGFLAEAEDLVSLSRSGGLESYDALERLGRARDEIQFLAWLMGHAEPVSREIPTKAASGQILARDVYGALKGAGASLSNGWSVALAAPRFAYADLTGFERLAELLEIHKGETPSATAKWLRDALAQDW